MDSEVEEFFKKYENDEFTLASSAISAGKKDTKLIEDDYSSDGFEEKARELGYNESTASKSKSSESFEDVYGSYSKGLYMQQYTGSIYNIKKVKTVKSWSVIENDESINYEWVTYKYLIYEIGSYTQDDLNASKYPEYTDSEDWTDTVIIEFIARKKTEEELKNENSKCSDSTRTEACDNCKEYVRKILDALYSVHDSSYKYYTPYIARVLGSWFRDTYFIIPEEKDSAIVDYINEVSRSDTEMKMIENSYGTNGTYVTVDDDYLTETGEYWTEYETKDNGDYQLYYLQPNGTVSDIKMEDFLSDPKTALEKTEYVGDISNIPNSYINSESENEEDEEIKTISSITIENAKEEAEADGFAFVKKAVTKSFEVGEVPSLEGTVWSAYEFDVSVASNWVKINYNDDDENGRNAEVDAVYDYITTNGGSIVNTENGGFYYTDPGSSVAQVEDAQRSQTNSTVKWLFKYRKYYLYDGSASTAEKIAEDKEAVTVAVARYLNDNVVENKNDAVAVAELLGEYGRSALRQAYANIKSTDAMFYVGSDTLTEDGRDLAEQWLEWQLDMYYSGVTDGYTGFVINDETEWKIEVTDEDGNTSTVTRYGDPRDPDLIGTVSITKTSLDAFSILENTQTLAAEYAYRDFKELIVELDYFDKEDLSDKIDSVFTWVIPELSSAGWPIRPYDKQNIDYGALIESKGTYDALKEYNSKLQGKEEAEDELREDYETNGGGGNSSADDLTQVEIEKGTTTMVSVDTTSSSFELETTDENTSDGHYNHVVYAYGTMFKQFNQGGYYGNVNVRDGSTQIRTPDDEGSSTLSGMGCGIYSATSLLSGYKPNEDINPRNTVEYIHTNYGTSAFNNDGSRTLTIDRFLEDNGVTGDWYTDDIENRIRTAFSEGKPVIINIAPGSGSPWTTSGGHYFCAIGADDGYVYTCDSVCVDGDGNSRLKNSGGLDALISAISGHLNSGVWIPDEAPNGYIASNVQPFEGYEGEELVSSPVTGKIVEYGTHTRTNVYTEEEEEVGYIVIEALDGKIFNEDNISNNSGDTDGISDVDIAKGLNLFYDEYDDVCAGYLITIDGFDLDLNITDEEENNGSYEQNEVPKLYNKSEQGAREEEEEIKEKAPYFVCVGGNDTVGSLPDSSDSVKDGVTYYVKEGKYLGKTYTDEEAASVEEKEKSDTEDEEISYVGPANYMKIIVKDIDFSVIDNVEDFFDIPDPEDEARISGIYEDLENIDENSSMEEKIRAIMSYFVEQGFTAEGAAGIAGNLITESTLDPTVTNSAGYHGLAQWSTSWWPDVKNWILDNGYSDPDSFAGQVRAIYEEGGGQLTAELWDELKSLTDPELAAELFAVYYEGCIGENGNYGPADTYGGGKNYQGLEDRKKYASKSLEIYQDESATW